MMEDSSNMSPRYQLFLGIFTFLLIFSGRPTYSREKAMGNKLFSDYAENENTKPRWTQKKYCKIFTLNKKIWPKYRLGDSQYKLRINRS